jgi:uncharacterized membrane protein
MFCLDLSFIGWTLLASVASTVISYPFNLLLGAQSAVGSFVLTIINTAVSAVAYGFLYMYMGAAQAGFYERAAGLIRPELTQPLYRDPDNDQNYRNY